MKLKAKEVVAGVAIAGMAAAMIGIVASPAQAVDAPHNLVISSITQTTVTADWQSVTDAELYQLTKNGSYAASSTDTHEVLDGLTCGTQYLIQTKVKVGGTWSALSGSTASGSKTITTASCSGGSVVNPPSNLVLSNVTQTTVDASWQSVTGAQEYQLLANGDYAGSTLSGDTTETIDGLLCNTSYYIQTKVKTSAGWSNPATGSGSGTITTSQCTGSTAPPTTPPTTPPPPAPTGSAAENFGWGTPISGGSDEFNYTGAPDSNKWNNYDNIPGHHGNGRRMAAQSTVANGFLTQIGQTDGDTGYISSKYRPGTMYGKWEVRMRASATSSDGTNRDDEYHPVVLLWPDSGGNSTTDDEVDFAEGTDDTSKMKFFLHYGAANGGAQTSAEKTIDVKQWHNYAVEWVNNRVTGYIDGVKWFEDTNSSHDPDQAMHSSIQLDYFPNSSGNIESKMQVDWIRQYAP